MRLILKLDDDGGARQQEAVERCLRLALGGLVSRIARLHVSFRRQGFGGRAHLHVTLRGGDAFEVAADGRDLDDAMGFVAARAAAMIARHLRRAGTGGPR